MTGDASHRRGRWPGVPGFSLIELLVALAIAAFAIAAALTLCVKAHDLQVTLDTQARLQETARYALAIVETDLRMAGFWGLTSDPAVITANASLGFPAKCGGARTTSECPTIGCRGDCRWISRTSRSTR